MFAWTLDRKFVLMASGVTSGDTDMTKLEKYSSILDKPYITSGLTFFTIASW